MNFPSSSHFWPAEAHKLRTPARLAVGVNLIP